MATTRLVGFGAVIVAVLVLLIGRLWFLQIFRGEAYHELALANRGRSTRMTAPRGVIVDRSGKLLVGNGARFVVVLEKDAIPRSPKRPSTKGRKKGDPPPPDPVTEAFYDRVALALGMDRDELKDLIKKKLPQVRAGESLPLLENIDRHLMARLYEVQDTVPGVHVEVEPVRIYPQRQRAAHILGFTASVSPEELELPRIKEYPKEKAYRSGDMIGRNGLEKQYDLLLRGTAGYESFEVDARGRRKRDLGEELPMAGATLTLALDSKLQEVAEKALGDKRGAVVAIDPRDGRVLAMASGPTYDLNMRSRPLTQADVDLLATNRTEINRAIAKFPPGSTFKIITTAAGLKYNRLPGGVTCTHVMKIGNRQKKCHGTHGGVGLSGAFAQSCDIYYYVAGRMIGDTHLAEMARAFGLGSKTGLDLPYEKAGTVPTAAWKRENYHEAWYPGNMADMAIGQGYDEATPLQIALVAAAVGNGGTVWEPHLVLRATDSDLPNQVLYEAKPKAISQLPLSANEIRTLQSVMRGAVTNGTGKGAQVPGIIVSGKSGTAETGKSESAHGWFTCYAARPGEAPSIAVCVFRESRGPGENFHGGDVSAPIAKQVIAAYFGVQLGTTQIAQR